MPESTRYPLAQVVTHDETCIYLDPMHEVQVVALPEQVAQVLSQANYDDQHKDKAK